MEYYGKLYGKIGNKYFDTGKTSSDFDNTSHQIEKLKADKEELLEALEDIKQYGVQICNDAGDGIIIDYETMAEIESLIQKHKTFEIK